jgi:hypothetical protein
MRIRRMAVLSALLINIAAAFADAAETPISPYLIGQNSFNADAPAKDADRAWPLMREARFRLIRIGGISNNDKTPSAASHARWIDSIRSIGAEPLVQVSSIDPPETAAALVKALNQDPKRAPVRFWSIGNEPTCVEKTTPAKTAAIAANVKARSLAMRAVDPAVKILFGDECYWKPDYYDPLIGGADDVAGMAGGVPYIDGITFHSYPLPGASRDAPYTRNDVIHNAIPNMRGQFEKCRARAARADSIHNRTGAARLSISITEFNIVYWNSSGNEINGIGTRSFLAGQFMAEVFGMGMEAGAFTVAPWSILESTGDGRPGDLGIFDGIDGVVPRPAYHHIRMIAENMAGASIGCATEKADPFHAYATRDKDTAAVLILNENLAEGFRFRLQLQAKAGTAATSPAIYADAGWDAAATDSVPPQATLLLKVHKSGAILSRTLYTLAMAERFQAPVAQRFPLPTGVGPGAPAETPSIRLWQRWFDLAGRAVPINAPGVYASPSYRPR